jgi:hypothetical protein
MAAGQRRSPFWRAWRDQATCASAQVEEMQRCWMTRPLKSSARIRCLRRAIAAANQRQSLLSASVLRSACAQRVRVISGSLVARKLQSEPLPAARPVRSHVLGELAVLFRSASAAATIAAIFFDARDSAAGHASEGADLVADALLAKSTLTILCAASSPRTPSARIFCRARSRRYDGRWSRLRRQPAKERQGRNDIRESFPEPKPGPRSTL